MSLRTIHIGDVPPTVDLGSAIDAKDPSFRTLLQLQSDETIIVGSLLAKFVITSHRMCQVVETSATFGKIRSVTSHCALRYLASTEVKTSLIIVYACDKKCNMEFSFPKKDLAEYFNNLIRTYLKTYGAFCMGDVCKIGGIMKNEYEKRFFVLEDFKLKYYQSEVPIDPIKRGKVKITNEIDLAGAELLIDGKMASQQLFRLITKKKVYSLRVESIVDYNRWLIALKISLDALRSRESEAKSKSPSTKPSPEKKGQLASGQSAVTTRQSMPSQNQVVHQGCLKKIGRLTDKNMYFHLTDVGELIYYLKKDDEKPQGMYPLKKLYSEVLIDARDARNLTFIVKVDDDRTKQFVCPSASECEQWISKLIEIGCVSTRARSQSSISGAECSTSRGTSQSRSQSMQSDSITDALRNGMNSDMSSSSSDDDVEEEDERISQSTVHFYTPATNVPAPSEIMEDGCDMTSCTVGGIKIFG
jgi:hypothetical protein